MLKIFDHQGNLRVSALILWFLIITILAVALTYYFTALRWVEKGAEIIDPDNVERSYENFYEQHQSLRTHWANLQATEQLITDYESLRSEDKSTWSFADRDIYQQHLETRRQQLTTYNNACGQYQAMWDNVFKNLVAPRDLPRDCSLIVANQ